MWEHFYANPRGNVDFNLSINMIFQYLIFHSGVKEYQMLKFNHVGMNALFPWRPNQSFYWGSKWNSWVPQTPVLRRMIRSKVPNSHYKLCVLLCRWNIRKCENLFCLSNNIKSPRIVCTGFNSSQTSIFEELINHKRKHFVRRFFSVKGNTKLKSTCNTTGNAISTAMQIHDGVRNVL